MRKRGGKPGGSINKKLLKLDEKIKGKINHLLIEDEKYAKPN